ncbi:MAG: AI-2E family transporter [Acidimicrobiia bacterium]|nr:AI-2E family transporter [Acidimicrobiia bacterium]
MTSSPSPYERIRKVGVTVWTGLGGFALLALFIWLLVQMRVIWSPLVFAIAIVYILNPLVNRLENRRVHRVLGSCISYILLVSILTAIGFVVVPIVRSQAVALAEEVPVIVDQVTETAQDLADRFDINIEMPGFDTVSDWFSQAENQQRLTDVASGVFDVAATVVEAVLLFLLAPVLAFYILVDAPSTRLSARNLVPEDVRDEVVHVAGLVGRALGGFVRGQLLVALIVGILTSFALWIIGLPLWLIIGSITGLLNLVPFVGPTSGGVLAVAVSLALGDWRMALWAAVAMVIVQQIDNHLISPIILRATVKLHPVMIILALLVGGSLAGLLGVLIAVPMAALVKIIVAHLWRTKVLGQSWDEATEAAIHEYEPPSAEKLLGRLQRIRELQVSTGDVSHQSHGVPDDRDNADSGPDN